MTYYSLSIANYLIALAKQDNKSIHQLGLMKLVYIAHGFMLAILDRPVYGEKRERVEAWRLGPVFPNLYHFFNNYGREPITQQARLKDNVIPILKDKNEKAICNFVYKRYGKYSDIELVDLLHGVGTPWKIVYRKDMNIEIPDFLTKIYYTKVYNRLRSVAYGG